MRTLPVWFFPAPEPADQGNLTPAPFTASLKCPPALKLTTLRALMGASWPVFGLRPTRAFFSLTLKEPKRLSMTDSPLARDSRNRQRHQSRVRHVRYRGLRALW